MMLQRGIEWLRHNWRWLLLNLVALVIMLTLLRQAKISRSGAYYGASVFDETFIAGGRWAIRFLLLSLAVTPLYKIFGWKWVIPLRKPAGLWAFGFGALHFGYYLLANRDISPEMVLRTPYMLVGFTALSMLAVLALTSNRWAMKWTGKTWKRLHRLVYGVAVLVILHVFMALANSKKALMNSLWYPEFVLYGGIAAVLLLLRVTVVRNFLVSLLTFGRVKIKRKREETAALAVE